jgi:hypothetical protein
MNALALIMTWPAHSFSSDSLANAVWFLVRSSADQGNGTPRSLHIL